jgi:hypothetical protein
MQQVKMRALVDNATTVHKSNAHIFDGECLNGNFFMYQLCDLHYHETCSIVDDPSNVSSKLTEKEGWYKDGTMARLREIIKRRWLHLWEKTKVPSFVDFEREQAELEHVLMSNTNSGGNSSSQTSPFNAADFASYLGDDVGSPFVSGGGSDEDDFFIFDDE